MQYQLSVSPGQPFNIAQNNVTNSVSGSWLPIGHAILNRPVEVQGVYWDATTFGAVLKIRDTNNAVWYHAICMGGDVVLDLLQAPITMFTPFEYWVSSGSNTIMIYGKYC